MSCEVVVLVLIILVWCWASGHITDWDEQTKQTYRDLYPYVGHASQTHPEKEGGAVWWNPENFEVMKSISLFDAMNPCLQADVQMKLFAGFDCIPNEEAAAMQIKRISGIPGVTYCPHRHKFQIDANSADELMDIAHKMIRITKGSYMNPEEPPSCNIRERLRAKLQKYSTVHLKSS